MIYPFSLRANNSRAYQMLIKSTRTEACLDSALQGAGPLAVFDPLDYHSTNAYLVKWFMVYSLSDG